MIQDANPKGRLVLWLGRHRRESIDLAALGISLAATWGLIADVPAAAALGAFVVAALVPLRPAAGSPSPWTEFKAAVPRRLATVVAIGVMVHFFSEHPLDFLWFGAVWPFVAGLFWIDWGRVKARIAGARWLWNPAFHETLRTAALLAATLWLMQGFTQKELHGASDALWYSTNLADTVAQERAGVFPIWCGQSIYQFNGSVSPIRVAPAFQYFGAILDFVTFRSLGIYTLQNTVITLLGIAAMFTCYLGLRELLPGRSWVAAGLAALFLSCPGVLGLPYNGDLYMSWTTVPLVPIIWFATVRSFTDGGSTRTLAVLAAALGLSFWGHAPIALWSTVLAGAAQVARIACHWRRGIAWKPIFVAAAVFLPIAAYPIGSVLFFPTEPGFSANSVLLAEAFKMAKILYLAYPADVLPITPDGRALTDFQPGYALLALMAFSVGVQFRAPKAAGIVLLTLTVLLVILLLPFYSLELALWNAVPMFLRNPTGNWPMTRLCLPMAAAIVFAAALSASAAPMMAGRRRFIVTLLVAAGCVWSFTEAFKFEAGSRQSTRPVEDANDLLLPENVQLTRYSYGFFPHYPDLPTTFTHGVTDPELENHLLSPDMKSRLAANAEAAVAAGHLEATYDFHWSPSGPDHHAFLDHGLRLEADRLYLLKFAFEQIDSIHGVLQLTGPHFFREYGLPLHGGLRSFGVGGMHSNLLPLKTTSGAEDIQVNFYPSPPIPDNVPSPPIAHMELYSYDHNDLPVSVTGWMPFEALRRGPCARFGGRQGSSGLQGLHRF
jgi:hypothetical protein